MRIFLTLLFCLFSRPAFSYCEKTVMHLFFANGMFNSQLSSRISYQAILRRVSLPPEVAVRTSVQFVAYNTDENILNQLFEVARQKSADSKVNFWRYLSHLSGAPDWFKSVAAQYQKAFVFEEVLKNRDLRIQIASYQKILENRRHHLLTIAHSQGNFFTNFAFAHMANQPGVRLRLNVISVATPAIFVFNHGPYVTLKSDCVISKMPLALPANSISEPAGFCDHEFVVNYLGGAESLGKIESAVHAAVKTTADSEIPLALDIKDFLNWRARFEAAGYQGRLLPHQCYAIRLVQSLKNRYWQNVACDRRGLAGLKDACVHCLAIKRKTRMVENLCPTYFGKESNAMMDMIGGLFEESRVEAFANHKECEWEKETFIGDILTDDLSAKTIQFLANPWAEIDFK
jgi:hypothetical protein